jgi:myosin heavy subunit
VPPFPQDLEDLPGAALNTVSVVQTLVARFSRDVVYTYAGPVLLAVNPYALLTDDIGAPIYDASVMFRYRK